MKNSLQIKLTRHYGAGGSLEIQLSSDRLVDDTGGLPEFDAMIEQANRMFDHFHSAHLPHMRFAAVDNTETKYLDAIEVRVTIDKGKRYVKVACAGYEEHGIAFWPEHMKANQPPLDPKTFPPVEGYKCKEGTKVLVEIVNGKPKKVLKIIAPT